MVIEIRVKAESSCAKDDTAAHSASKVIHRKTSSVTLDEGCSGHQNAEIPGIPQSINALGVERLIQNNALSAARNDLNRACEGVSTEQEIVHARQLGCLYRGRLA